MRADSRVYNPRRAVIQPDSSEMWYSNIQFIPDAVLLSGGPLLNLAAGYGTEAKVLWRRMRNLRISLEEINDRLWLIDTREVMTRELRKLGFKHVIKGDALDPKVREVADMPKKFSVVIGNPPYQPDIKKEGKGSGSGNKIWHKFVELGFELCEDYGYTIMVTPNNWRRGNILNGQHRHAQKTMWSNTLLFAEDVKRYFPSVGHSITIDAWGFKKDGKPTQTGCPTLDRLCLYPLNRDSLTLSVLEKFFERCYRDDTFECTQDRLDSNLVRSQDDTHTYKFVDTAAQMKDQKWLWSDIKPAHYDDHKVFISRSGQLAPQYLGNGCGSRLHFAVASKDEGAKLSRFLESHFIQFVMNCFIADGNIGRPFQLIWRLPRGLLTSNDPLHEVFHLTEEEIEHVE
jgi:hypothetical protein